MDANRIIQTAKTFQANTAAKLLRNGESSYVRVLADKGGGRYEGTVSGVKVSFTSARPLSPGSTFVATVSVKGNTIILVPKEGISGDQLMMKGVLQAESGLKTLDSANLSVLLQEIGLPGDGLSLALLQMAKQMEMKVDPALLQKVRSIALRFGGRQKSAAEVLMMLAERGIPADEDDVLELLRYLEGDGEGSGNKGEEEKEAFINKINSKEGSWYLFPYEMVQEERAFASGSLRMLFDKRDKLKLVNLFCKCDDGKDYYFSINYEKGYCKKIRFNIQGKTVDVEKAVMRLSERIHKKMPDAEIEWSEKDDVEGSACAFEELYSFGGQA
ncbi:MAG: hypothetical protein IJ688_11570 [Treponema sp.]|nr:hypothetical protein [Treponema sp.]